LRTTVQWARAAALANDRLPHTDAATQTVVGHGQQAIGVRRQIDARDLGFLIGDVIDEPRILV
jgi:hypothetical protein